MNSPLNTAGGTTGQIEELTVASGRSFKFPVDGPAELSFSMPGHHPQTRAILPLVSDVLVFRDGDAVQRFRVVSRSIDWGAEVSVSFAAVSYRGLVGAWLLHDSPDADKRNWPVADGAVDTPLAAWNCFNFGQGLANGALGVTRGVTPGAGVLTVAAGTLNGQLDSGGTQTDFFPGGTPRDEVIDTLASLGTGFEWDITVDQSNPYTGLKFDVWSKAAGGRNQHGSGVASPFILDDGGNVLGGSHAADPSAFGNVIRVPVDPGSGATVIPPAPAWEPTSRNPAPVSPALDVPEGRWERAVGDTAYASTTAAASAAPGLLANLRRYTPTVSCSLRRGRWGGRTQLWLGDEARFILTVSTEGTTNYLLNIDEQVKVYEINVAVDDLGAEDVTLALNRRDYSSTRDVRDIYDRVARLERR